MVSRRCEQCGAIKRCLMYLDPENAVIYLCTGCARELEYAEQSMRPDPIDTDPAPPRSVADHLVGGLMTAAPVTFVGYQERRGLPPLALWTLTAPVSIYPVGTTLCSETLTALGIPTPEDPSDPCGEGVFLDSCVRAQVDRPGRVVNLGVTQSAARS